MNHRKLFYVIVLSVLLMLALSAVAQEQAPSGQEQQPRRGGMMMSPQDRVDMMAKELNLTDDQKAKIKTILEDNQKQMQTLRGDSSMSQEDRRAKMMEMRTKEGDAIKAVLDKDQQKKYDDMMAKMRERRGPPKQPQ